MVTTTEKITQYIMTYYHHRQVYIKFALLCLILLAYFLYISFKYDVKTGGIASMITWSFFVLCTPIADAGFLVDFPIRLLFGVRMFVTEILVWVAAITINLISFNYAPFYYSTSAINNIFYMILKNPFPYWGIILLSGIGTFLSIRFGDELVNTAKHSDRNYFHEHKLKHKFIIFIFFFIVTIFLYYRLLSALNIKIDGI